MPDMTKMYPIKQIRKDTITALNRANLPDDWQNVCTPYSVVNNILELIPDDNDLYIVFFSLEFLEVMIHEKKIPREKILFVADTEAEFVYANWKLWYNVPAVKYPKQNVTKESMEILLKEVDMKFKKVAVVGNPPYQISDGVGGKGSSAKPLYHLFVESIIDGIKPDYFSFIIPSRWMIGGKGLDNHRERMMNDKHLQSINHFPGEAEIFESVLIKGGVNYFLWNKHHSGECLFNGMSRNLNDYDIILQDNNAVSILEKVRKNSNEWISQKCNSRKPFGITSDFSDWDSSGHICYSTRMTKTFITKDKFTDKNNILNKWKVCTSKGINPNDEGCFEKYNSLFIAEPNSICTETYLVVNSFDTEEEANNFLAYMKTKFFRFFLGLRVVTQNMSSDSFSWVPNVVNYCKLWNDKVLYEKFKLDDSEIDYIESKTKEI
jgi:site-specific DNA-methyltransferase (adenine-specific)